MKNRILCSKALRGIAVLGFAAVLVAFPFAGAASAADMETCKALADMKIQNTNLLSSTGGKPGAPFVCIEPWFGYADTEKPYGEFTKKPGMIHLEAGDTFTCEHRISVKA